MVSEMPPRLRDWRLPFIDQIQKGTRQSEEACRSCRSHSLAAQERSPTQIAWNTSMHVSSAAPGCARPSVVLAVPRCLASSRIVGYGILMVPIGWTQLLTGFGLGRLWIRPAVQPSTLTPPGASVVVPSFNFFLSLLAGWLAAVLPDLRCALPPATQSFSYTPGLFAKPLGSHSWLDRETGFIQARLVPSAFGRKLGLGTKSLTVVDGVTGPPILLPTRLIRSHLHGSLTPFPSPSRFVSNLTAHSLV